MRWPWTIAVVAMLAGCSGSTGGVTDSVGTFTAPFLAIDLASGRLESYVDISEADLRTDAKWKTSKLVFRRIEIGGTIGQVTTDLGADGDEPVPQTVASRVMFVGVFEVTQAQWTALGGASRWLDPGIRAAGGLVVDAQAPAYGLSREDVAEVLADFNAGRDEQLALPTNDQWEIACRGGVSGTSFWWGDDPADTDALAGSPPVAVVRAVVADNTGAVIGPRVVDADRAANPAGLYDTHGNVWEWVDSPNGTVRGGSWNDSVSQARAANRLALDQAIPHPLVGARFILVP